MNSRHPVKVHLSLGVALVALGFILGCGQSAIEQALDSDANGYLCPLCKTKFYTEREVFASFCPQCKQPNIQQVVGYVCQADQHVTLGARGRGSLRCEQCGQATTGLGIPREKDFQAWGAPKKAAAEVN